MKNLRELFNLYHNGFQDFVPWLDHHIEMHRRHPLECAEFGAEWLRRWEAVGRLLDCVARTEWRFLRGKWHRWEIATVGELLAFDHKAEMRADEFRRVVLLGGTIIREWGPK